MTRASSKGLWVKQISCRPFRGAMRLRAPLALLALVLLLPGALAQETAPVLVERIDDGSLVADLETNATAVFRLFNLNPDDDFYVSATVAEPLGWSSTVSPNQFFLLPRNATEVSVAFRPEEVPRDDAAFTVTFSLVHGRTGTVTEVEEMVQVASGEPPRVLDVLANPLPAPLDNVYGTFLLEMAFWALVGLVSIFAGDAVVRSLTARASRHVTSEILTKLRRPIFYFVLSLGLSRSFSILPRNAATEFIAKTLIAIGVGIFGLYVLYRILDAALYYYQKQLAPKTATNVDDVVVPVIRKVGLVVIYAVGIIMTLRTLGWDPTIVFAGAGIAGLVIAFAAQDTFSNLFSGIFLLLDQPFKEGDDIQLETGEITRVMNIGLRTTRLYHGRNNETITVPNNQLATRRIVNLAGPDPKYWVSIDVGASYTSDPAHVMRVLEQTLRQHPKVLDEPNWEPLILFSRFGESSLDFVARAAVADYRDRVIVGSELRRMIKDAFDREGIEIPFPQRTLWIKEMPLPER